MSPKKLLAMPANLMCRSALLAFVLSFSGPLHGSAAAVELQVWWMTGNAGRVAGHATARHNRARWTPLWGSFTPQEAAADLKKWENKAEENKHVPIDFMIRSPSGNETLVDTQRSNSSEAIKAILKWSTQDSAAKEKARIQEDENVACYAAKYLWGDSGLIDFGGIGHKLARLDPFKVRWSKWKSPEQMILDLQFDHPKHRGVAVVARSQWNGTHYLEEKVIKFNNLQEATEELQKMEVKKKPLLLASLHDNITQFIQTMPDEELKAVALEAGATQLQVDACLKHQQDTCMNSQQEQQKKKEKRNDSIDTNKIAGLKEEMKKASEKGDYRKAAALMSQIGDLSQKSAKDDPTCLQGLVFELTQGPVVSWRWDLLIDNFLEQPELEEDIGLTKTKQQLMEAIKEVSQWHVKQERRYLSSEQTAQEAIKEMHSEAHGETERKKRRPVDLKVKKLTGDKTYYDEKPQDVIVGSVDDAIEELKGYRNSRCFGLQGAGLDRDASDSDLPQEESPQARSETS